MASSSERELAHAAALGVIAVDVLWVSDGERPRIAAGSSATAPRTSSAAGAGTSIIVRVDSLRVRAVGFVWRGQHRLFTLEGVMYLSREGREEG